MPVKVIMYFGTSAAGKPFGTSESHFYLPSEDLNAAQTAAQTLVEKRYGLMGSGVDFFGLRLTVEGKPRVGRFVPSGLLIKTGDQNQSGSGISKFGFADQPNACLYCRGSNQDTRFTAVYLTGVPDALLRTNPVGPAFTGVPGWQSKFEAYRHVLVNGNDWGFKARALNPPTAVVADYVQEQTGAGYLGAVTTTNIAEVGDTVQIRNSILVNKAFPKVNGQWQVAAKATDATAGTFTYFLRNSQLLDPLNIAATGTIEKVTYSYFSYTCFQIRSQTTRKRGVGGIKPRGRSRSRRA